MTFGTSIQTFAGGNTIQSSANTQCAVDWTRGKIYIADEFNRNVAAGITQSDIVSGVQNNFALFSTLNDPTNHIGITAPLINTDANGDVYLEFGIGLMRLDPATWSILETWGTYTGGGLPPGLPDSTINGGMSNGQIINVPLSGIQFNIACAAGGLFSFQNIAYWMKSCQFNGQAFEWLGDKQFSCAGASGSGNVYMFSGFNSPSDTSVQFDSLNFATGGTWIPANWPTPNPQMTQMTIKTYVPTDIDAGWTAIDASGVCLDQTDGHPMVVFSGQSGATTRIYIVKVNKITGAVIWKTAMPGTAFAPGAQFAQSRIQHQTLCVFIPNQSSSPPNTVVTIDTSTGSSSSYTTNLNGLALQGGGAQSFDDTLSVIVGNFNYTLLSGGPTPLNASASPFSGWAALYVAPPFIPPRVVFGSAYFIERMDNREWTAAENTWCVDCGLTTTLPTPNAILSGTSATGAGVPISIAMDVAGQGYSPATTASIEDPTGSGATIGLTIASGMITGATISGGVNYTYPVVSFNDPAQTGLGASAVITLDNTAVFNADSPVFNSGMVGQIIRMGGGVATVTAYNNSQQVVANITTPIAAVLPYSGNVPLPQPAGNWSIAPTTTVVRGLNHLIGYTVTGVADGAVVTPRTVLPDGTVVLDAPASLITLGLPFTPQFQSLYLDGGSPTVQGQRKKVAEVTVRLDASGVTGIVGGSNQPTGSAQSPPVQIVPWEDMDLFETRPDQALPPYGSTTPPLFTGDISQPVSGGFDKPGQVAFQQNLPLPMNITAIIPEALEGDSPEQGYQPKPQREPRGKPKSGGGRGER